SSRERRAFAQAIAAWTLALSAANSRPRAQNSSSTRLGHTHLFDRRARLRRQRRVAHVEQHRAIDRLHDELVAARRETLLALSRERVRRDRDDLSVEPGGAQPLRR